MKDNISPSNRAWLLFPMVVGCVVSPFTSCRCGDPEEVQKSGPTCENRHLETNCEEDLVFRKGECVIERCDAVEGGNCCPGMTCSGSGECKMNSTTIIKCEDSAQCPAGQMCLDRPLVATDTKTCGFPGLGSDGNCPVGMNFFAGRCVINAPCDGFCDVGKVCNIETNICEDVPYIPVAEGKTNTSGCDATCGTGELLVYEDPDSMIFDHCCEIRCRCASLPPIAAGVLGRFSDLDLGTDAVYVSTYDDTYGDLVMNRYSLVNGALIDSTYIDGVPTSGHLVGDPTGIRNGFTEGGPNVGQYTAIAVHDGLPSIAYYDLDNHALKFARMDGSSVWSISTVDTGRPSADKPAADTGRFIDLMIDNDNRPQISYMMVRGMLDGSSDQVTGLVYAKAKKSNPSSKADWDFFLADSAPIPAVNCNGACPDKQSCVFVDSVSVCRATSTECNCGNGQACVLNDGVAKCLPTASLPTIGDVVKGVGLYTNLINYQGTPWVVYHDSIVGSVKVVRGKKEEINGIMELVGFEDPITLDGYTDAISLNNDGVSDLDVGRFASAYLAPDLKLHVAYLDATNNRLRHFWGIMPSEGYAEVVDDGIRDDGRHYVGADSAMIVNSTPSPVIAYQDSTNLDLVVSYYNGGMWHHDVVSPCGDVCTEGQSCVTGSDGLATCLATGSKVTDCPTSCTENQECVKINDNDFSCRDIKDDISNGFFLKMVWDKDTLKAYITDLEIGFDATQHRANTLGLRVLDASKW